MKIPEVPITTYKYLAPQPIESTRVNRNGKQVNVYICSECNQEFTNWNDLHMFTVSCHNRIRMNHLLRSGWQRFYNDASATKCLKALGIPTIRDIWIDSKNSAYQVTYAPSDFVILYYQLKKSGKKFKEIVKFIKDNLVNDNTLINIINEYKLEQL